jgi:hypothetical protein
MTESSIAAVRDDLRDSQATADALKEKVEAGELSEADLEAAFQTVHELQARVDRLDRVLSKLEARPVDA